MRLRTPSVLGLMLLSTPVMGGDHVPPPGAPPGARHYPLVSPPGWIGPGPATGRWRGVDPGLGWSYYGVSNGPYLYAAGFPGFFPYGFSRNGDYWSNGMSLYGPPVPVYGPTAGQFGNHDNSKLFFARPPYAFNGAVIGLGWAGRYSPSPRPKPPTVAAWPGGAGPIIQQPLPGPGLMDYPGGSGLPSEPAPFPLNEGPNIPEDSTPLPPPKESTAFRVTIRVPTADAEVWVNKDYQTKQTGLERVFETPPLEPGKYRYQVIARWKEDGTGRAESREVVAKPGDSVLVDFTRSTELLGR